MIAHKRLKVICAVLLTVVLTVGLAVPVFASPATDENGNWIPDSFDAFWSIWDPDTSSYKTVEVTTSVSRDGLDFVFPFNAYGITSLQLWLIPSSDFYFSSVAFSGHCSYDSGSTSGSVQYLGFTNSSTFTLYDPNLSYTRYFIGSSNPFSYINELSNPYNLHYCRFIFFVSAVSGVLTVHLDYITFNNSDVASLITVRNLDNASQDLTDLGEQLDVPKPTIQVSNIVEDALEGADYQSVGSTTWSFMSNDLITKMLLITVSFALLGYILFGKKESGSK